MFDFNGLVSLLRCGRLGGCEGFLRVFSELVQIHEEIIVQTQRLGERKISG
jgi:hypothetical protein